MHYNRRYTGEITAPIAANQVFVFNSYSNGLNKAGTAKAALQFFGATRGIGEGLSGQSYAIPSEVPLDQMRLAVKRFIEFAKNHPNLEFLVTPIGVGKVFKRDLSEMAHLFIDAVPVENIILPIEFANLLDSEDKWHSIAPDERVVYKLIDHGGCCDLNESAVMKQKNGKYTLLGLSNMAMGGYWSGFHYCDSMSSFDRVLLPVVIPKGFVSSRESDFIESCVLVSKNGRWGCVSTRCEDYSKVVVPICFASSEDVKKELKQVTGLNVDFLWRTYEEYYSAHEFDTLQIPSAEKNIKIFVGDITTLKVDAIVNAANTSLLGGGGIDGAIHKAAGPGLLAECKTLGGCRVGESKMTDAYNLPCKKIIHTVGPNMSVISDMDKASELLRNCYNSVLDIALQNNLKSVAFCCISTGIYGFPKPIAARIALETIYGHPYDGEIHICCYTPQDKCYYDALL